MGFGEQLVSAGERFGRLCVGIDPHAALLQDWGLPAPMEAPTRAIARIEQHRRAEP